MLHGGEIYGDKSIQYDFSVNINPLGIPESVCESLREGMGLLQQYPDQDCTRLRRSLSDFTGISAEQILCGNGASELIEGAVRALCHGTLLLTAPSFSGYRHAALGAGVTVREHLLRREENFVLTERILDDLAQQPDMVILCSPANPVGNTIDPALMEKIAEVCAKRGIWLLVDECFIGFLRDGESRTMRRFLREQDPFQKRGSRLLVLDAFTKRFAMPGLRLGYLMAQDPAVLSLIHRQLPEWSVSVPAQIAGTASIDCSPSYLEETARLVEKERKRMVSGLSDMGFRVFPGEANFIFFSEEEDLEEVEIWEKLYRRGILIRSCDNYSGLQKGDYRAAVRLPEENTVLLDTIREIVRDWRSAGRKY